MLGLAVMSLTFNSSGNIELKVTSKVNVVSTDNFSLKVNSEEIVSVQNVEDDETPDETPRGENDPNDEVSPNSMTTVTSENTSSVVEEGASPNTSSTATTVKLEGFKSIIPLLSVEQNAKESVEDTSNHSDNNGFEWFIGIHTSTIGNHTSQEGITNGTGIISQGSGMVPSVDQGVLEDNGNKSTTETSQESVSSSLFSHGPERSLGHDNRATSVEENETEPEEEGTSQGNSQIAGSELIIAVFIDLSSELLDIFKGEGSVVVFASDFMNLEWLMFQSVHGNSVLGG